MLQSIPPSQRGSSSPRTHASLLLECQELEELELEDPSRYHLANLPQPIATAVPGPTATLTPSDGEITRPTSPGLSATATDTSSVYLDEAFEGISDGPSSRVSTPFEAVDSGIQKRSAASTVSTSDSNLYPAGRLPPPKLPHNQGHFASDEESDTNGLERTRTLGEWHGIVCACSGAQGGSSKMQLLG